MVPAVDWLGMCNYNVGAGMQYPDWIHAVHLRPSGDLKEDDGLVEPRKVIALPHRDT